MKIRSAKDAAGDTIRLGDIVRVIGAPELKGMSAAGVRASGPIFKHVVGTYRRIRGFDQYGFAENIPPDSKWPSFRLARHRYRASSTSAQAEPAQQAVAADRA
jgi:hypothetical protein